MIYTLLTSPLIGCFPFSTFHAKISGPLRSRSSPSASRGAPQSRFISKEYIRTHLRLARTRLCRHSITQVHVWLSIYAQPDGRRDDFCSSKLTNESIDLLTRAFGTESSLPLFLWPLNNEFFFHSLFQKKGI